MNVSQLLDKLNYFSGKDKRGKTFKITEFNTLLPTVQDKLVKDELDRLLVGDMRNIPDQRVSISPLRVFHTQTEETVDDGVFPLPGDYVRYISISNGYKEVDVISQKDFNSKRTSPFRSPVVRPFCYITSTDIVTCPSNIGVTTLLYFRKPTTPYFDYCQDSATLNEIFMPVLSTLVEKQADLYDLVLSGVTLASNVYKTGGSDGYVSKTVELEWEEIYHDYFVMAMLSLVGINIQMNELTQYAEAKT